MGFNEFLKKDYEWERKACSNKKGYRWVYSYKGKWKQLNLTGWKLWLYKAGLLIFMFFGSFVFLYGSSIRCKVNQVKGSEIFLLLVLGAMAFLYTGVGCFLFSKEKVAEPDIVLQKRLITWSAGIGLLLLIISVACSALQFRGRFTIQDKVAIICQILTAVCVFVILLLQKFLKATDI